ncbi:hypothetical protein E8E11_000070 [Didymella keratinophila]|nr:hypothetical protein E8E11_000070 [Didymella keratinophila]
MTRRQLFREEYTVEWVCALSPELAAAKAMLDEEHGAISSDESNLYCVGSMAGHNVVIVCLPAGRIGNNPAAAVATQMQAAFKGLRFGLMVGIGGGVPSAKADIRLGDVVVSHPKSTFGGVVQYDMGKSIPRGFRRTGLLNAPPQILLSAVNTVRANEMLNKSNQVIKNATKRNKISNALDGVLCFEMEAARLMDTFPCLVIRGICDYADSHKNDEWQSYAAATAAAYAKELLTTIPAADVMEARRAQEALRSGNKRLLEPASLDPASAVRDSSKRSKHDSSTRMEDGVERTDCVLFDRTFNENSTERNKQRTVTHPSHQQRRRQPPIHDEQKQNMIESLRFDQIDARQMTIKPAHAKTCKWLLNSSQYIDWLDASKIDEHYRFLWIKGKARAGKSTLMKFATVNAFSALKSAS